jgi:hypothetical protein
LTNARRAAAEKGSHDALSPLSTHRARAHHCSSPAMHHPSPRFQHKTGSPSGRPLDRKSSVSHRAPLAGHRPISAPARQNGTEHAGRKERIGGGRRSVSPRPGRGPREKFPSVWSFPSFLVVVVVEEGVRRDAMRCDA